MLSETLFEARASSRRIGCAIGPCQVFLPVTDAGTCQSHHCVMVVWLHFTMMDGMGSKLNVVEHVDPQRETLQRTCFRLVTRA